MFIWFRARQVCCVSVCFHSFLQGHTEPCLVWMHRKRNLTASASIRTFRKKQACMRSKQVEPSVALYMRCKKVEPSVASSMQAAQARVVEPSRASNMFALSASWTFRSIRHVCNGKERDYHPIPTPTHHCQPNTRPPPSIQHHLLLEARGSNGSSISDGAVSGWFRMWVVVINCVLFMFVSQCYGVDLLRAHYLQYIVGGIWCT